MRTDRRSCRQRREILFAVLRGLGDAGGTIDELLKYPATGGDPVGEAKRRERTLRNDLRLLERHGKAERVPGGRPYLWGYLLAWRAPSGHLGPRVR